MSRVIEMESYEEIPEYTHLGNNASIEIEDGRVWYGHAYARCAGMVKDDGTIESYFKTDKENGNTEIFDKLRSDINLIKKHCKFRECNSKEIQGGTKFFIPYKVKDHCSSKPTITDSHVDRCSNVHYDVEYEILMVADDEFKRFITVEFKTEGSFATIFFDQVESIEDLFEEWFEENSHGFYVDGDGNKTVTFYDETGYDCNIDISSVRELLSMITSIRVIKCERTIID